MRTMRRAAPYPGLLAALLLVLALITPRAAAAEAGYGVAAGVAAPLGPTDGVGGMIGLSAMATGTREGPLPVLRLRGELLGLVTSTSQAVLPTLTGELGGSVGPVDLFLCGGVELFGFAWRGGFAMFSTVGLLGGGGLALSLSPRFRLGLRATVIWLPDPTTATMVGPDDESIERPPVAFMGLMLTLDIEPDAAPSREQDTELMPPPEL